MISGNSLDQLSLDAPVFSDSLQDTLGTTDGRLDEGLWVISTGLDGRGHVYDGIVVASLDSLVKGIRLNRDRSDQTSITTIKNDVLYATGSISSTITYENLSPRRDLRYSPLAVERTVPTTW